MESAELKLRIDATTLNPKTEPDPFAELESILDTAEEHLLLPAVILHTDPAVKAPGVDPARYYLNGMARLRSGDADGAYKTILPLTSRLEQETHWRALGLLAARALDYSPRVESALSIAKAIESVGLEFFGPAVLQKAYENFPDEARLAYLMGESNALRSKQCEAAGDAEGAKKFLSEARAYWAEALDAFVVAKKHHQIEDVLLKLADASEPGILRHVLTAFRKLGNQNQWARLTAALEIALPAVRTAGLVPELWHLLLHFLPEAPATSNLRKQIAELAPEAFPGVEGISDILSKSGVLNPEMKLDQALKSLEPLIAFAPGYHVLHASWGVGRLKLNDGDSLIIDFAGTPGHRMSVNLARRALVVIPPDDLRVLKAEAPDELKRRVKEDPGGIAFLAIRQLGGEASTQDVKRVLQDGILTSSQWAGWWKEAKAAMEGDARFDLSQAFRQNYRIREQGAADDDELPLPIIEPRRGIRPNLNLIRRFLEQHPSETARAARTYAGILERWAKAERTNAEDRMAIYLQLHRWKPQETPDLLASLGEMLRQGTEASVFSDLKDQDLIVRVGLRQKQLWKEAACFALSSRAKEIRELAFTEMRKESDKAGSLIVELMQDPASRPLAALTAMDLSVMKDREPFAPEAWDAALGAASLVESTSREQVRKLALGLLDGDGPLASQMLRSQPTELQLDRYAMVIRRWRSSERFLHPVVELLRRAGHEELVKTVRQERMEKTNLMLASSEGHVDYSGHLLTRFSFDRMKSEMERLNLELRTTVAQSIAKARALGDLRENAEYESAKQKQASHAERIAFITQRLQQARIIDELAVPAGQIAPGTEITVEDLTTRERRNYWMLGEGDDVFGPEVVSYAAPMGKAMLGRKEGDTITMTGDDGPIQLRVVAIARRIPTGPPAGYEAPAPIVPSTDDAALNTEADLAAGGSSSTTSV